MTSKNLREGAEIPALPLDKAIYLKVENGRVSVVDMTAGRVE